jgi:hypothetical protein
MAPHGSRQPDIDLAGLVADDIDGAAGEPLVEQFSEPLVADARVPLAQGVKEFFPRQREDRRSGSGHMTGHGLASLHTSSISRNLERSCRHARRRRRRTPGLGHAVRHQRDKSGQCEGRREEGECHKSDHDQLPFLEPEVPASWDGGIVLNYGFGRCDRHHKNVECRPESVLALKIPNGKIRPMRARQRDRAIPAATRRIFVDADLREIRKFLRTINPTRDDVVASEPRSSLSKCSSCYLFDGFGVGDLRFVAKGGPPAWRAHVSRPSLTAPLTLPKSKRTCGCCFAKDNQGRVITRGLARPNARPSRCLETR